MQRHFFSLRIAALVILAAIVVAMLDLRWRGYAVVHDPSGLLAGAALAEADGRRSPMREFAAGYWAARPLREARFELACRSGRNVRRGHAAPGAQATYTLLADDCRLPGHAVGRGT